MGLVMKIKDVDFSSKSVQQISYVGGKPIDHIVASFNQTGDVYPTDTLDSLRAYLTVSAVYEDGTVGVITNYRLSGKLTVGYSTITALYGGFKATFVAEVSINAELLNIDATFNQGSIIIYNTDSLDKLRDYLVVVANYEGGITRTLAKQNYNLIGALIPGLCEITIEYGGETDTIEVNVTEKVIQPEVTAYAEAVGITSDTTIEKLNTFVTSLKSEAIWDKLESIFPFMGSNTAGMLINLKNADAVYPESCLQQKDSETSPITVKEGFVRGAMNYYTNYINSEVQTSGVSFTFRLANHVSTGSLNWLSCANGSSTGGGNGYVVFIDPGTNTLQARANTNGYDATKVSLDDVPLIYNTTVVYVPGVPTDIYVNGEKPTYDTTSANSKIDFCRSNSSSNPAMCSLGYGGQSYNGDVGFFVFGKGLTATESKILNDGIDLLKA